MCRGEPDKNMRRKQAIVRVFEFNGVLVVASREQKIDAVKKWFEKSESTRIENWRIFALTDERDGISISARIENADFTTDDLPMIL